MSTSGLDTLLQRALRGAFAGAAQHTGLVPGMGFKLVADTVRRLVSQPKAVEFIARAMHAAETGKQQVSAATAEWEALSEPQRNTWRKHAAAAMAGLLALCEHGATAALKAAAPGALGQLATSVAEHMVKKRRGR